MQKSKIVITVIAILILILLVGWSITTVNYIRLKNVVQTKTKYLERLQKQKEELLDRCKSLELFKNKLMRDCKKNLPDYSNLQQYLVNNFSKVYPKLAKQVITYTFKYSSEPLVLLSLIAVESSFDFQSISNHGAYGATQIKCSSWRDELIKQHIIKKSCKELFDPETSIKAGSYVLDYYVSKCGSLEKGLSAYLTGSCTVNSTSKIYVRKVFQYLAEFYLNWRN